MTLGFSAKCKIYASVTVAEVIELKPYIVAKTFGESVTATMDNVVEKIR